MTRSEWPFVSLGALVALAALGICVQHLQLLEQRAVAAESRATEAEQTLFGARVDLVACVQQLHGR